MKIILKLIFFYTILFSNAYSQISVIVNKSIPLRSISKEKIIDIYTLNTQNWDDGTKIIVIDYKGENDIKNSFYEYLDFPFTKMQKVWLRKQFSGAGLPPFTFRDFKEIIEKVSSTPGAIAYIPSNLVSREVNVVAVF